MKMDEYLQKKKGIVGKQKELQDKMKELEEAERKAQEIKTHLKEEKKKERSNRINNFSLLGMQFRPWTLNDMIIVLFVIIILVVGTVSFIPGGEVSSDVDSSSEKVGFFAKLFGGFTVKSLDSDDEDVIDDAIDEDGSTDGDSDDSEEGDLDDSSNLDSDDNEANLVNFDVYVQYQDSSFTTLNAANVDHIWYDVNLRNKDPLNIKCIINHYANNKLKEDQSTITVEAGSSRIIKIRELASDAVDTLVKSKLEISCSDGVDGSTKRTETKHLTFYFFN